MRIEVKRKSYPGDVITDEDLERQQAPKTIQISDHSLAQQMEMDLADLRLFLKSRAIHLASVSEKSAGLGLCSEELAALSFSYMFVRDFRCPLDQSKFIGGEILSRLLTEIEPVRVWPLVIPTQNGTGLVVTIGENPPKLSDYVDPSAPNAIEATSMSRLFDATLLRNKTEDALKESPLRLPQASDVKVKLWT